MLKLYRKHKTIYDWGRRFLNHKEHLHGQSLTKTETEKKPLRTDIINFVASKIEATKYLEIGVRNPDHNFNHINITEKYSVDPGIEFTENPVDFPFTSDDFFSKLKRGDILSPDIKFDIIFIDGLHLADQVEKDIENALEYISDNGFIIIHDCNPPTEYHARENYSYDISPAQIYWNGTTWKAFVQARQRTDFYSCCIDSDWGVGIINKNLNLGEPNSIKNPYFEFDTFKLNRKESLNLLSFDEFKSFFTS